MEVLWALSAQLREANVSLLACVVYAVEQREGGPAVCFHALQPGCQWEAVVAAEERDAMVQTWQQRAVVHHRNLGGSCRKGFVQMERWLSPLAQAAMQVPFSHGVLAIASTEPEVFQPSEAEAMGQLATVLSTLFRRLAEVEMQEQQLSQTQQLALIGQLAAGAVHELNNALMVIMGQCELLLADGSGGETRESIETISKAAANTQSLASLLLGVARSQGSAKKQTDLNQLVHEVAQLMKRQLAHKQVQLVEELQEGLPLVEANSGQLQQLLINLIHNSRDAILSSKRGGRIWIRTRARANGVQLEVEDDGSGIPEGIRDRIFEPFFTTKEKGAGTGLGLSVCRAIAREHGGRLRLGAPAEGTRVVLELPC
ncbi:MAG: HAMP domain-containing histidine kinase [Candidatus Latescibacteria bacterium]|nr:HAMP domain-containing histidine kinase [Candidatus Latescibacterota bacterium]